MRNILITGGTGYIGSILACRLEKKYCIFVLDKDKKNIFHKYKKLGKIYFSNPLKTIKNK
jgi:nucleoside-diphosphate-sugar epimerase